MLEPLIINDSLVIPTACISWTAVRSSGAGGQNVNKVSSKIELRFDPEACQALPEEVRIRLCNLARNRLDAEGKLIIVSQASRDQRRNLETALERLREMILKALEVPKTRHPTRPTRASRTRRLEGKRIVGIRKQTRRGSADEE
ncbi:MAG: aminoacyl-tRNA hydrolase [Candidatus Riflebacteria bacterium]|nr:aminoacyl-tRNA hydrolase [Candidatus Riflebacteria bacterium]